MGTSELEVGRGRPAERAVAECADLWSRLLRLSHRFHLSYWTIRLAGFLARHLPAAVCYAVAHRVGAILYGTWPAQRNATVANMRRVLGARAPEREVRRLARNAYINYFTYLVDFLRSPHMSEAAFRGWVEATGWENLDRALSGGKGVIMVTMHLGSHDLAAAAVAGRGYRVNAIVESFDPPKLNELIQSQRLLTGVNIIPLENPTRKIINALRRNEVLALLIDRPTPDGVEVEWFGGPVRVPAGAAALSLKTGARIVTGACIRESNRKYRGEIHPAIEYTPTGNHEADVRELTRLTMAAMADPVRRHPDQWFMFRRFWRDG